MAKSLRKEQPPERGAGGGGWCCLGLGTETRRQLHKSPRRCPGKSWGRKRGWRKEVEKEKGS